MRKYLSHPDLEPRYKPRPGRPTLLDPLKGYVEERLAAGVWNAVVLTRELKERGYEGEYSTVKEYLQPKREAARTAVVRRFETPPGRQVQVDWGHLGTLTVNEENHRIWGQKTLRATAEAAEEQRRKEIVTVPRRAIGSVSVGSFAHPGEGVHEVAGFLWGVLANSHWQDRCTGIRLCRKFRPKCQVQNGPRGTGYSGISQRR